MVTLPVCQHRGRQIEPPSTANADCGVHECQSAHFRHPGFVGGLTCINCRFVGVPNGDLPPTRIDPRIERSAAVMSGAVCIHRGQVVEHDVCNICGMKGQPFDVFACALHGKCSVRRYRNDRPELKVCANCDDFAAA